MTDETTPLVSGLRCSKLIKITSVAIFVIMSMSVLYGHLQLHVFQKSNAHTYIVSLFYMLFQGEFVMLYLVNIACHRSRYVNDGMFYNNMQWTFLMIVIIATIYGIYVICFLNDFVLFITAIVCLFGSMLCERIIR